MNIRKKISKTVSIILVLAMIFSLMPNNLFVKNVQAATMAEGDDLVSSDPYFATSSNWGTSNMTLGNSGAIVSEGTSNYYCSGGSSSSFWGNTDIEGYVYWNTETTFPAGIYTITLHAAGTGVTMYPYLDGKRTDSSATVSDSDWKSLQTITLTIELDSSYTGYMGVYAITTSTSAWIDFTNISIVCTSLSSSSDSGEGAEVDTSGTVYIGTEELSVSTEVTKELEWGSGNVDGTFETGTLSTSTPTENGFYATNTSYTRIRTENAYVHSGTRSVNIRTANNSNPTLYYGASDSSSNSISGLKQIELTYSNSTTGSFEGYTDTFTATKTTMYYRFSAMSYGNTQDYLIAVLYDLTVGTEYTVTFYTCCSKQYTTMNNTTFRYIHIDDVTVEYTSTVNLSGNYDIYRDEISDITVSVGDSVPTFPSTINLYLNNVDDKTDTATETVEVEWDKDEVNTSKFGKYTVTGTFTYNNKIYTITSNVYVLSSREIISSDSESDFDAITEEVTDGTYTWYETSDWFTASSVGTKSDWIGTLTYKANTTWDQTADYGVLLYWSWEEDPDGEILYSVYDKYETYLAPGEYTFTFDAIGTTGTVVGCYFDGKFIAGETITSASSMTTYTVNFTVQEPILQTLVGIYIEGKEKGSWGWIDNVNLSGYQFDETDADEVAAYEDMFLVTDGYDYVDLAEDKDGNPSTDASSTYKYSFVAGNTETSETNDLLTTGGFFNDSDKTYLEWDLGSGWWSTVLSTNNYSENIPDDWEDGQVVTWISDTIATTDAVDYTIPILPAGTYTLYYSTMGLDGTVQAFIKGNAVGETHGLAQWDKYQYYSYTFTVDSLQFDYKVGVYYSLNAAGYAYTDDIYVLGTEEITEDMLTLYKAYRENKVATSVTYDSGTIGDYSYQSVADAGTYDLNQYFTGTSSDDGKVLTDKSVTLASYDFEGNGVIDVAEPDDDAEFNVALSALSQSYEASFSQITVTGGKESEGSGAVDVVFVLDISMSMIYQDGYLYDTKLIPMIEAVNEAIDVVLSENPDNRVAVVGFTSNTDTVTMIDLTSDPTPVTSTTVSGTTYSYDNAGEYIGYKINTASEARNVTATIGGADGSCLMNTFGTFTQKGISLAGNILENAELTDSGELRTPYVFLLSDGEADYYNTDYTASPITSATNSSASYTATTGYYTLLTANYWKREIASHYTELNGVDTESYFYTVGFDLSSSNYLEYATGILNPSILSSATGSIATSMLSQLNSSVYADDYDYVTEYSDALDAAELVEIFEKFTSVVTATTKKTTITNSKNAVNTGSNSYSALSSYLEITDYIGTQMQVVGAPYVSYQGKLYYPAVASGDTSRPVSSVIDADGNTVTTYKYYAYVNPNSATEKATEDSPNLSELIVQITTYKNGEQKVYFAVPAELLPACTYNGSGFIESLPIRLVYRVQLVMDENIEENVAYYTNKWGETAYTTSTFVPSVNNPYYYTTEDWVVDGTYITDTAIDYDDMTETVYTGLVLKKANASNYVTSLTTKRKTTNATNTIAYSYLPNPITSGEASVTGYKGTETYTDDVYYMVVEAQLGNNGKIVLLETQSLEYYVWLGHEATLKIGASLENPDYFDNEYTKLESDTETADVDYSYTLSGEDEELVLNYTNTNAVGDYVYTLTAADGTIAEVKIHVYNVNDDLYVLDYGLGVSLVDNTYENGLFNNDLLVTEEADTVARYTGIRSTKSDTENTKIEYSATAKGVQGTVSGPSTAEIDTTNKVFDETLGVNIVYTPTKFMSDIDEFNYQVVVLSTDAVAVKEYVNSVTMNAGIQVMPAENVYYEDNFASSGTNNSDATAGFIITGETSKRTDSSNAASTRQNNSLKTQYGYDEAYSDDIYYSNASATQLITEVGSTDTTATFQFKGTGFAVYARCNTATASIAAMVYDTDGNYVTNSVVNTFYQNGSLYQIPVISITDLNYGEYVVKLYVIATEYQATVYLDGLRIYNPAGTNTEITDNYIAGEADASYDEIRSLILGKGYTTKAVKTTDDDGNTVTTSELVAGSSVAGAFVIFDAESNSVTAGSGTEVEDFYGIDQGQTGKSFTTSDYYSYLTQGPNNETYLSKNEGVAITLQGYEDVQDAIFQIGAKSVGGKAALEAYVLDYNEDDELVVLATDVETVATSTEMYYKVNMPESASDNCVVYIMNTGDNILSLTNIKLNGYSYSVQNADEAGEDIDYLGRVTSTVCDYLARSGRLTVVDDNNNNYGDRNDDDTEATDELENTVKAQVTSVDESGLYSLRFVGTIDGLDYLDIGFLVTIYDEEGNVLKEENAKKTTSVYTAIKAGDAIINADEGSYFYAYSFRNISADNSYYFQVANYTTDTNGVTKVSGYKYYQVSNGTISVVESVESEIGGVDNE